MPEKKTKPKPKITLSEALFGAQQDAQGIKKGSRNTHHGYDYTSAEDMLQFGSESSQSMACSCPSTRGT